MNEGARFGTTMHFQKSVQGPDAYATTEGRQDKKPHIAAWTVGCFVFVFSDFLHIAAQCRDVRVLHFTNDFSENRTSRIQP